MEGATEQREEISVEGISGGGESEASYLPVPVPVLARTPSPSSSAKGESEAKSASERGMQSSIGSPPNKSTPTEHRPSASSPEVVVIKEVFSWPDYLKECGMEAAKEECFFQDPILPTNKFEVGKKIEVPDPRGNDVYCLATIVFVHSVWICVRLDGEDASNDRWLICDDNRIRPVGETERRGSTLQPPYGYMYNLASFHKFIENQLKIEEDDSNPVAPLESFTPISEKYHPGTNKFEVGMKCEAIDHKNFNGRPCPATVVAIDGDTVTINYDGWNQAYDTKERYDSRYLFPIGWAAKAGLEIQPPKRIKGKVKPPVLQKETPQKQPPKPSMKHSSHKGETPKRKSLAGGSVHVPRKVRITPKNPSSSSMAETDAQHQKATPASATTFDARVAIVNPLGGSSALTTAAKEEPVDTMSGGVPAAIGSSSSVKTEFADENLSPQSSGAQQKPRARKTIPSGGSSSVASETPTVRRSRMHISKKSLDSDRSMGSGSSKSATTSPAPDIVLSTTDGHLQPDNQTMTVYIGRNCRCEPMLNRAKVQRLEGQVGPGAIHHVLREVLQQIVNCSDQTAAVFKRIEPGTPRIISITAEINGSTHVRAIPAMKNLSDAWSYLRTFLNKLEVCPNLCSSRPGNCSSCELQSSRNAAPARANGGNCSENRNSESGDSDDTEQSGSANADLLANWSVDRVAADVALNFGPNVANRFALNQIDGKALMLLTTELLIRHLDMPFGPALKMMSYVESLKHKYRRASPSAGH